MSEDRKIRPQTVAQREALKALAAPRRKPDEADRPPLSVLPGGKHKPLPGQLALGDDAA